jgi:hypothetical protein
MWYTYLYSIAETSWLDSFLIDFLRWINIRSEIAIEENDEGYLLLPHQLHVQNPVLS